MRWSIPLLLLTSVACGEADREPPIPGPQPLRFASGAFDRARGRLVVYTPSAEVPLTPEPDGTWAYDGESWTREDAFGPLAREAPGMVYDEARGRMLLFGGERVAEGRAVAETHVYEAGRWRQLDAPGPAARHSPAIAYDLGREGVWMYGGFESCTAEECQALWFFDGAAWRRAD